MKGNGARGFATICLVAAWAAGTPVTADEAQELAALKARSLTLTEGADPAAAVAVTAPLAEAGNLRAVALVGFQHDYGIGLPQDQVRALELYRQAAEAGFPQAMFNVGIYHEYGFGGLSPDPAAAREWYVRAAAMDFATALTAWGVMLRDGIGGPADAAGARAVLERAVSIGDAQAMAELAFMLAVGTGGAVDLETARELYQIAALRKIGWAARDYAEMLEFGEGGPTDMAGAVDWYERSASMGYAMAGFDLYELYRDNPAAAPDRIEGLAWCFWAEALPALANGVDYDGQCEPGLAGLTEAEVTAARDRATTLTAG
jgi:hypothetical protein